MRCIKILFWYILRFTNRFFDRLNPPSYINSGIQIFYKLKSTFSRRKRRIFSPADAAKKLWSKDCIFYVERILMKTDSSNL